VLKIALQLLKIIGVLFYTFVGGISLYVSIQISRFDHTDLFAPVTAWAVTLVIVLVGVLLVVRPSKPAWHIRAVLAVVLILVFAFFHQYIVAFPGRVEEAIFETNLRTGMSRDDTEHLAHITFGGDIGVIPSDAIKYPDPNAIFVYYTDFVTVCVGGGNLYVVHFDQSRRVKSWNVYPWADGC
jgi:hypothetical protein